MYKSSGNLVCPDFVEFVGAVAIAGVGEELIYRFCQMEGVYGEAFLQNLEGALYVSHLHFSMRNVLLKPNFDTSASEVHLLILLSHLFCERKGKYEAL